MHVVCAKWRALGHGPVNTRMHALYVHNFRFHNLNAMKDLGQLPYIWTNMYKGMNELGSSRAREPVSHILRAMRSLRTTLGGA